jgi:hypothetical protein
MMKIMQYDYIEELKKSTLPDVAVASIWLDFKSDKDRNYTAVHVFDEDYILLSQKEKDKQDFSTVREIVVNETQGSSRHGIADRGSDICDIIDLEQRITQAIVAGFIERYQTHFKDIAMPIVMKRRYLQW